MILVDTSVLVNYFRDVDNDRVTRFEDAVGKGIPYGINNYIYQEILQGAKTEKEFVLLREYL